jgi:2'-hydroxyisoflavone reductase
VIYTSGYLPCEVRASAGLLAGSAGHYTFVSSISVYEDFARTGLDEDAPVLTPPDPEPEKLEMELYGGLKVGCERAAEAAMSGRTTRVRPGMIVGPHDYTNRFPYWCRRVAEGGEMLAPGDPEQQVQLIDVWDLAGWILLMAEGRRTGV